MPVFSTSAWGRDLAEAERIDARLRHSTFGRLQLSPRLLVTRKSTFSDAQAPNLEIVALLTS
jgi:hypothetical protein